MQLTAPKSTNQAHNSGDLFSFGAADKTFAKLIYKKSLPLLQRFNLHPYCVLLLRHGCKDRNDSLFEHTRVCGQQVRVRLPQLVHNVEICAVPIDVWNRGYTVPVVYEALRRSDSLEDARR